MSALFLRASPAKQVREWIANAEGASEENLEFWVFFGPRNARKCTKNHSCAHFQKSSPYQFSQKWVVDGSDRKNPPAYPVYAYMGMKFCKLYPSGIVRCDSSLYPSGIVRCASKSNS